MKDFQPATTSHLDDEWGISAEELLMMDLPPIEYLVEGLLPEGLTLLVARPKSGKSFFSLQLSVAIASGTPFIGLPTIPPGEVLYLALEDDRRRIQRRIQQLGYISHNLLRVVFELPNKKLEVIQRIDRWRSRAKAPRLVVVDTLGRYRPPTTGAGYDYNEDTASISPLHDLARSFGLSILVVHHTRKAEAADFAEQ